MVGVVQPQVLRVAIDDVGVRDLHQQVQLASALAEQELKRAVVRRGRSEA